MIEILIDFNNVLPDGSVILSGLKAHQTTAFEALGARAGRFLFVDGEDAAEGVLRLDSSSGDWIADIDWETQCTVPYLSPRPAIREVSR